MSNLFDFSSLAMIPTAYKDGKLYSIRPVPEYGAELVTNGDFATDSDWTKGTGTTISGGTANFSNANGVSLYQNIGTQSGSVHVTFSVTNYTSGTLNVYSGGNESVSTINVAANSVGIYSANINRSGGNANIIFGSSDNFTGSIDNVSFKEVIVSDGDFTFTRGSNLSATRVDVNGLIEKGRENLLLQSNSFDTTWINARSTETSGQSGYDGTSDAWLLESTATATSAYLKQNISNSGVYTMSVYAKAGTSDWLSLNTAGNQSSYFDLENGVLGSATSNVVDSSIESIGNGWYRCSATLVDNNDFYVFIANGDGNLTTNSGDNILIQDSQLESGLAATDVIETTTTTGKAGILENTPRFDYLGATCPSLLLEPSRTNIFVQSEYFTGVDWDLNAGTTLTDNYATSPEGVQNATRYVGTGASGLGDKYTLVNGTQYTISAYVKSNTGATQYCRLIGDSSNISSDLEVTTEWTRIDYTWTSGGLTNKTNGIFRDSSNNDIDILIFALQLEAGSYPTSYIPTMGVSQTRAVDDVNELTGATSLIGQSEGTMFLDFVANDDDALQIIYQVRTTGSTNLGQVDFRIQSGNLRALGNDGGSPQYNISAGAAVVGTRYKCAVRYATNDVAFYVNGVLKGTDTNASFGSSSLDQITFNENGSLYSPSVNVKQALLFKTGLTNTELASLTTI